MLLKCGSTEEEDNHFAHRSIYKAEHYDQAMSQMTKTNETDNLMDKSVR
jgi:hypothetical protein